MFIAAAIGAVAFLPSIVLNIALACGAPWGAYAMNGQHKVIPPELRKAHQANDKAVMQAYGFSIKMTESECVAQLFKLYEKLAGERI